MNRPLIWVVAAGTGGHIFPGLSLAEEIKKQLPEADFLFFGTRDRMESKLVPAAGFTLRFLSAGRWKGSSIVARLAGIFSIFAGFFQSLLQGLKHRPAAFISIGGYVSVPVALAAVVLRIPRFIVEPNIVAGMANVFLSRAARAAFSTPGSDAASRFKCPVQELGNPLRKNLKAVVLREKVKRVLVLGGSQGALSLCRVTLELARDLKLGERGVELVLQSGEANRQQSEQWQTEFGIEHWTRVQGFVVDVPAALEATDLVIARAGAMTVAELCMASLPTIFVPFPFAADDHQRLNAQILEQAGAARVALESVPNFKEELAKHLEELCFGPENFAARTKLSANLKKWARPNAGVDIAKSILSLSRLRG